MKRMIFKAAAAALLLLPFNKAAAQQRSSTYQYAMPQDESFVGAHFSVMMECCAYHFTSSYDQGDGTMRRYNDFNPGIGVEYKIGDLLHVGTGVYRNSLYRPSVYALAGIESSPHAFIGIGVEAGMVSGYLPSWTPAARPYLRLFSRDDRANVIIGLIPPVKAITPAVLELQLRINLGQKR